MTEQMPEPTEQAPAQEASMGALNDSERAELEALRAQAAQAATAPPEAPQEPQPPKPDTWLLLGNGQVIESVGAMTQYKGIAVVAATPMVPTEEG